MNDTKQLSIKQYIEQPNVKARVQELLKDRASQFMITINSMVSNDAKLQECEPASLFTSALTIVALDLPVNNNLGFAWIIPYKAKDGKTYAQAQLGYKAFIQLAQRSRQFKTINVSDVRQGEIKSIDRLSGDIDFEWQQDDEKRNKLPIIGYVAYMKLNSGFEKSFYMTAAEARAHGTKYSANYRKYKSGMWADEFDAMAKKTVVKLLLSKYAPMSTEMAKAQTIDQAVLIDEKTEYVDNQKLSAEETAEEKEINRIKKYIKAARTLKGLEVCKNSCTTDELIELYKEKEAKLLEKQNEGYPATVEQASEALKEMSDTGVSIEEGNNGVS